MNWISVAANVMRRLPKWRGHYRACAILNKLHARIGGSPLFTADMWDGTRMQIDLRSQTEFYACFTGEYDRRLIERCLAMTHPESSFIDVGGNVGFYAVALGFNKKFKRGGGGICFEPHPGNFQRIAHNIAENRLDTFVNVYNYGLSDIDDTLELVMREDFASGSSTGNASIRCNADFDSGFSSMPIRVRRLDGIIDELPIRSEVDLIKVDIEGHEDCFLRGAEHTLRRYRPIILTEVNLGFLHARQLTPDEALLAHLPDEYEAWNCFYNSMIRLPSLNSLNQMHNVFLIPRERRETCQKRMPNVSWIL